MKIILLALLLAPLWAEEGPPSTPPAVIWGAKLKEQSDIFQIIKMKTLAFRLRPLLKDHMMIVYFEPELTAKNLSCSASNCFAFLRRTDQRTYYSKVRDPLKAVEKLLLEQNRTLVWSKRSDLLALPCKINSIYVSSFYDHDLIDHDHFMQDVASNLASCAVVQVYTALKEAAETVHLRLTQEYEISKKMERLERMQRKRDQQQNPGDEKNNTKRMSEVVMRHPLAILVLRKIVYAKEIHIGRDVKYERTYIWMAKEKPTLSVEPDTQSLIKGGLTFIVNTSVDNVTITLAPVLGNWRLTKITFSKIVFKPRDLVIYSKAFSYCCSSLTAFSDKGSRITLYSFNMDVVIHDNVSATDPDFRPQACWLCQEYMTPGLVQGIFTVAILLALLAVGFTIFLNMGHNARLANASDPEPHVKVPTER